MFDTDEAVRKLTETHEEIAGSGALWPPLLEWLEDLAVQKRTKGKQANSPGIPLNEDALQLRDKIDGQLKLMREALGFQKDNRIDDTITAWIRAKHLYQSGALEQEVFLRFVDEFKSWVTLILSLSEIPTKLELTVPCPRCEQRWVMDGDDRRAAVVVEYRPGQVPVGECRNDECEAIWAGWEQISRLGITVGSGVDMKVLEACGISLKI